MGAVPDGEDQLSRACLHDPPHQGHLLILQHDAVKVGHESRLFDEKDMLAAMDKIELINYHQTLEHKGVRFVLQRRARARRCYVPDRGRGRAVLYTGDFSREEDRHLLGAEIDQASVLIVESTYGVRCTSRRPCASSGSPRPSTRSSRAAASAHPVFALGRSQELLLILDEYWKAHPELHEVPIYYASKVAKVDSVYQTYINMMNEHIRSAHAWAPTRGTLRTCATSTLGAAPRRLGV